MRFMVSSRACLTLSYRIPLSRGDSGLLEGMVEVKPASCHSTLSGSVQKAVGSGEGASGASYSLAPRASPTAGFKLVHQE